ncbi:IS256 family transposase [Enterococcus avium]|uniref:Mutator family transposase n=1 Tax=Enterococcus avium TaxID=33945 RepID=A0A8B5W1S0_ENTAV|nr:IS256 family transposase [Enterococcus avium]TRZ33802.1 IS256 family transposase [Enterococcus avium]TRZ35242.1 IS256 family transposase [Enterococcus avium]
MNQFTTEIMYALAKKEDLNDIFRSHLELAVNELLETELTEFLGYSRYDREGIHTGNSRNGKYLRSFDTKYGTLNLSVPRDRNGEFHQRTLPAYDRRTDALEETVIQLYRKGITTSEIADLIEKMYGAYYTPQTISNITKAVAEQVVAFQKRKLSERYVCVYLDATYLPLRRDSVAKEAIHLAIGIRSDGSKEVLNYRIAPTESAEGWRELLLTIQSQGVKEVLLFVTDGLTGLDAVLSECFPKAKQQRCLVHIARNICHNVRVSDRKLVTEDFKRIHLATTKEEAEKELATFLDRWCKQYPKLVKKLSEQTNLLTFFDFPPSIRCSIYSTNLIEGFNKHLKRATKKKEQFPNEEALERFLVTQLLEYNNRHDERCHRGFAQCRDTLESMFI